MEIIGYKCFDEGLINRYGFKFELGKVYVTSGMLKFGNNGNGFHMCKNIEDTFRYFDAMNSNVDICLVKGSGNILEFADEYYGYYNMYVAEKLELLKKLSHEQIINMGLNLNELRVKRFLSGFKLTNEEIEIFKNNYKTDVEVLKTIAYYQENNIDVYTKKRGVYYG